MISKTQFENELQLIIQNGIREDVGEGDHSSLACIPATATGKAKLLVKEDGVIAGVAFAKMILEGRFDDALAVARQQVENGAQVIDINMDEAMLDSIAAMDRFLKLIASEPDISRVPIMLDSSKWEVI